LSADETAAAHYRTAMASVDDSPSKAGLKVLLLEDQGIVRAGMRALIQISEPRAQIHEAATFSEACGLLGKFRFDLAFLDVDLTDGHSGMDVLRHIRDREMDTKVIMLSGRIDPGIIQAALDEGASGYIPKAMDEDGVFRHALDRVIEGGVYLPDQFLTTGRYSLTPVGAYRAGDTKDLGLTDRQLEVLYYVCAGLQYKVIAYKMEVSEHTIRKNYVPYILKKLRARNRSELMSLISQRGITLNHPARA
jgi:two-component system nitrate/nitrite response regulator NarL